jgi:hypothetical protein
MKLNIYKDVLGSLCFVSPRDDAKDIIGGNRYDYLGTASTASGIKRIATRAGVVDHDNCIKRVMKYNSRNWVSFSDAFYH